MQSIQRDDDAFGAALVDCLHGKRTHYIIEREDGFTDPGSLGMYFADFAEWGELDKRILEFVRGRVLDVGCGAGRHAIHLQNLGFEVVGIDKSPLAIQVAKERGLKEAYALSLDDLARNSTPNLMLMKPFDSVIMMGHNIGLLHGADEGKKILRQLKRITSAGAKIIGTTRDPGKTSDPDHLAYQAENRDRGRMPGQIRFRIRHRKLTSDWLDYLFLSEEELLHLVDGTGWQIETTIRGDTGFGGDGSYLAVLCKNRE
jgi:SAM-dependent methyltransferase